jgi:hypothetical protein
MKWMQLLFLRTLKRSHTTSFVDAWTSYLRDSHANPFPPLANDKQPTTNDTSTLGSQMELPLAKLDSCCSKTLKGSSQQKQETENPYLNMSSETWKKEVTKRRGAWRQRTKLERPIEENVSSSWHTPRVAEIYEDREKWLRRMRESNNPKNIGKKTAPNLTSQVNWYTPDCSDRRLAKSKQQGLSNQVKASQPVPTNDNTSGKNREQLSPNWVEQLMGVPVGLTQLPTELID